MNINSQSDSSRENGQWKGPEAGESLCITERGQMAMRLEGSGEERGQEIKGCRKDFQLGSSRGKR